MTDFATPPTRQEQSKPKSRRKLYNTLALFVILTVLWFLISPGVFSVQPIGALPEGGTFIYYGRSSAMSVFSSPDGMCLQLQGEVNLLCRLASFAAIEPIGDRIILRLPYQHWAYLISTGGKEFEN